MVDLHKKIWCAPLSKMDPMRSFLCTFCQKTPVSEVAPVPAPPPQEILYPSKWVVNVWVCGAELSGHKHGDVILYMYKLDRELPFSGHVTIRYNMPGRNQKERN